MEPRRRRRCSLVISRSASAATGSCLGSAMAPAPTRDRTAYARNGAGSTGARPPDRWPSEPRRANPVTGSEVQRRIASQERFEQLLRDVGNERAAVLDHPVYAAVDDLT